MAIVPFAIAILTIAIGIKVGHEIGCRLVCDVEISKKHPGKRTNWTQLNQPMPQCPMFINPALLIMLGIISKSSEDLEGS
jgi:hypothetical protein